jgi:hypothetical protein
MGREPKCSLTFDRAGVDQKKDLDLFGLADPIAAVDRLFVRGPIHVVENNPRGGGQIETDAAGIGRQQHDRDGRVVLELIHDTLPLVARDVSINAQKINVIVGQQIRPNDVQHPVGGKRKKTSK